MLEFSMVFDKFTHLYEIGDEFSGIFILQFCHDVYVGLVFFGIKDRIYHGI